MMSKTQKNLLFGFLSWGILAVCAFAPKSPSLFVGRHTNRIVPLLFSTLTPQDEAQQLPADDDGLTSGGVHIPSTGISVTDEMEMAEKDRFETELVPITGYTEVAAQIVTTSESRLSFEPVRYLVSLSPANSSAPAEESSSTEEDDDDDTTKMRTFALVDMPPYSPSLVAKIKVFMGGEQKNSRLAALLITSRDGIHYDDAPAVYRMRRADLEHWKQAFPGLEVVAYRMDIPRDCREFVTQVLDGYGPFALQEETTNCTFVETGRPLTYTSNLWDHDEAEDYLRGRKPIDEVKYNVTTSEADYTPEAIRAKEENKRILAVYTPGHTFGSVSYIFPETGFCCSGFTIPVEDTREEDNPYMGSAGPALDCRGYITTNRGGIQKQMQSARELVRAYSDRFHTVLASRADPLMLHGNDKERKLFLLDLLAQYEKIGKIYEELGITGGVDDDDEDDE
ncbi:expressed unknown protein [Seminavis robusta]|uniref:Uncharacterized protein n=1 Tax=Seminavis robusta TaxID=568900 RepID=A0A9N8D9M9_9STRA|nr:expressed unknown protein [Seminavis robusta]|eukprot:Sro49_g028670.1 n/a (452) ;mRNA; f:77716-79071